MTTKKTKLTALGSPPTNGGEETVQASFPYILRVEVEGVADFLFHRWNCDSVELKSKAAKGSAAKKNDDCESYVYRNEKGNLSIPGEYLRQSIIHAAKFQQDPRSPRKSAMDLFKAGLQSLTQLSDLGVRDWSYLDRRRVTIQRSGVTRIRPAMTKGWRATFDLLCSLPEYIPVDGLVQTTNSAGRLIGVGDFRPTFGRFVIKSWKELPQ